MKKHTPLLLLAFALFMLASINSKEIVIQKQKISHTEAKIEAKSNLVFENHPPADRASPITPSTYKRREIATRNATNRELELDGSEDFYFISLNNSTFSNLEKDEVFYVPIPELSTDTKATVVDIQEENGQKIYTGKLENPQSIDSGYFFLSMEKGIILASFFIEDTEYSLNTYQSNSDKVNGYIYEPGKRFNKPDAIH